MKPLTKDFLQSLGISLDDQSYPVFVEHFNATLQGRIIESIIDSLDDEQVDTLSQMRDSADSEELWQWVQRTVPELPEIIQQETDILLGELAEHSENI